MKAWHPSDVGSLGSKAFQQRDGRASADPRDRFKGQVRLGLAFGITLAHLDPVGIAAPTVTIGKVPACAIACFTLRCSQESFTHRLELRLFAASRCCEYSEHPSPCRPRVMSSVLPEHACGFLISSGVFWFPSQPCWISNRSVDHVSLPR